MRPTQGAWNKIIEAISTPLGFFVLALLIVEAFLATVLVGANLESAQKIMGMWLGVVLFVIVTVAVFILVWHKPQNLTYDKEAHLVDRGKAPYGTETFTVLGTEALPTDRANPQKIEIDAKRER